MAKDRKKLQHIHSSIADKQPTAASLEVGEIAVNNAKDQEFLSVKNSEDKVVRFSSDGQMIDWVEKKEVIPYSGTVDNVHLDTNRSNIEIKLNQVVAKNTVKHNVVNGAKDIDGQDVNPSSDGGLTNGAGFAIDMSRYAMIGANPSFSSITVTNKSDLSGTTNINGSSLNVTTTTAEFNDKTFNVTTTSGANITAGDNVCIKSDKDADFYGSANTKVGVSCEGDITKRAEMQGEDVVINATTNNVGITAKKNICETAGINASFYAVTKTNLGLNCDESSSSTTTNVYGNMVNVRANTIQEIANSSAIFKGGNVEIESTASTCIHAGAYLHEGGESGTCIGTNCTDATPISPNTIITSTNNTNIESNKYVTVSSPSATCIASSTQTSVGAPTVKIGTDCGNNTIASAITINSTSAITITSVTENHTTTNLNVTANTENHTTSSFTVNSTSGACITSDKDVTVGGNTNTKIGYNCAGSGITDNVTVYSSSSTTINSPTTIITGNTNISGNTIISGNTNISGSTTVSGNVNVSGDIIFNNSCASISSNTLDDALCEVMTRNRIYIEENHNPSDTSLAAIYTFYQNDKKVTNSAGTVVEIEVAKDKVLKEAKVVKNDEGEWVIRLTWLTYDPDTGTSTETTTDILASELVKDIDAVDSPAIDIDIWYDSTSGNQKISADTTIEIKNAGGSGTKTFSKSDAKHSLTSYVLNSISGDVKSLSAATNWTYDPFERKTNIIVPTDVAHINRNKLKVDYGNSTTDKTDFTYDPGSGTENTSRTGDTIYIPTCVNHLNRHKLTIQKNGTDIATYDPGKDCANSAETINITVPTSTGDLTKEALVFTHNGTSFTYDTTSTVTFTAPHSALTINYEATSGKSGTIAYDTSSGKTISIPTCVNHLNRHKITFQSGATSGFSSQTFDAGKDCANSAETINIPTCVSHLNRRTLAWSAGTFSAGTHDPGGSCTTNGKDTISIPSGLAHLTDWSTNCLSVNNNLCVSGTVTSTQGMYTSSDISLKNTIGYISGIDLHKANKVNLKSFKYNTDPTGRKVYGVIAQDVEEAGLNELVFVDENGLRSVDYTGLLILKLAALDKEVSMLRHQLRQMTEDNKD